jgi:hypothetical protein
VEGCGGGGAASILLVHEREREPDVDRSNNDVANRLSQYYKQQTNKRMKLLAANKGKVSGNWEG